MLGYSPANGLPELRRTARHLLERDRGLEYADAEVAVECGAKQVDTVEPDGAFYLLPRLAAGDDLAVADALLEVGCATVPGNAFGAPGRLRLSFATDIAALEEGCRTLVDVLDEVIS
ncbi:MAG: aminotransferase class I/II-fold pyridoxal phosphate-dependent enzyme [Kitasatospora sp.]|nr:aminotransferase class I/II-fold pyridoxal phosphate-dependent enzyme [Kitasatospora sp.]